MKRICRHNLFLILFFLSIFFLPFEFFSCNSVSRYFVTCFPCLITPGFAEQSSLAMRFKTNYSSGNAFFYSSVRFAQALFLHQCALGTSLPIIISTYLPLSCEKSMSPKLRPALEILVDWHILTWNGLTLTSTLDSLHVNLSRWIMCSALKVPAYSYQLFGWFLFLTVLSCSVNQQCFHNRACEAFNQTIEAESKIWIISHIIFCTCLYLASFIKAPNSNLNYAQVYNSLFRTNGWTLACITILKIIKRGTGLH